MKRMMQVLAASALLSASVAWAVAKGGPLYIKAKDVQLLKDPKVGSKNVVAVPLGSEVKWLGPSDKDKSFHEVEFNGKKGFVLMSNLSPSKPAQEIGGDGKSMSAQSFANSAAATKGLTSAGVKYAGQDGAAAAADVVYIEEHTKAKATPTAVAAKAKELGGGK
ncbi:MAG: hypothetical protein U0228_30330 [Myxococcaceae bacterium]